MVDKEKQLTLLNFATESQSKKPGVSLQQALLSQLLQHGRDSFEQLQARFPVLYQLLMKPQDGFWLQQLDCLQHSQLRKKSQGAAGSETPRSGVETEPAPYDYSLWISSAFEIASRHHILNIQEQKIQNLHSQAVFYRDLNLEGSSSPSPRTGKRKFALEYIEGTKKPKLFHKCLEQNFHNKRITHDSNYLYVSDRPFNLDIYSGTGEQQLMTWKLPFSDCPLWDPIKMKMLSQPMKEDHIKELWILHRRIFMMLNPTTKEVIMMWPLPDLEDNHSLLSSGGSDFIIGENGIFFTLINKNEIYYYTYEGIELKRYGKKYKSEERGEFYHPTGLALEKKQKWLYVCDQKNHRIQVINHTNGICHSLWGQKGKQNEDDYYYPQCIVLHENYLYIGDYYCIRICTKLGEFIQYIGQRENDSNQVISIFFVERQLITIDQDFTQESRLRVWNQS